MRPDFPGRLDSRRQRLCLDSLRRLVCIGSRSGAQNARRTVFRTGGHIVFGLGLSFAVTAAWNRLATSIAPCAASRVTLV